MRLVMFRIIKKEQKMKKTIILIVSLMAIYSCSKNKKLKSYDDVILLESESVEELDNYNLENISTVDKYKETLNSDKPDEEYLYNSLSTGATPYAKYYGKNKTCNKYGCSQIKVRTSNSDVLVTIKKLDKVVRHAYIQAGDSYTFSFPNGEYQAFFYYGKGWNPEKEMKGGEMKGGFVSNEDFQKDSPQNLHNNILEYELILQQNGNFSTQSSDSEEAL